MHLTTHVDGLRMKAIAQVWPTRKTLLQAQSVVQSFTTVSAIHAAFVEMSTLRLLRPGIGSSSVSNNTDMI